jgi:signal transduction histidine kinase/DNA-binding response OmpR family regulator
LEDDPADVELVQAKLEDAGLACRITRVQTRDEFGETLWQDENDIILADYRLPMYDGMSALQLAQKLCPDIPFIFVSGTMGEEAAIEGLTEGATDYVLKQNLLRLGSAVKRALNEAKNRRERKGAQRALQESEAKMRSILENIGIGVALISPKMEILEINHRMREWHPGIDPGQRPICYRAFNDPPGEEVCDYCPTYKTLQDGLVHEAITQTPHAGILRNYRIISSPIINASGEVTAAIEIVEDITEKLALESRLQQAQKMESMGSLAGGIAHDFNNIISVIMGCAELSMSDIPEKSPIYQHQKQIFNAGQRAADLVQQILTFSRQKDPDKRALQISTIIKEVLKMLRASLPTTIEIKQNIAPDSGMVLADATQIHQVLMNLCTNAAHAMRKNVGVLEIMLANVDLTFDDVKKYVDIKPGAYVKLTVSDTGTGMDHRIIERVFDPYFTTKKAGEGTGLWLAVVHGIISQYGGAIEVQSEPGRGTAFHILIPRIDHEQEMAPKKDFCELPKGSETILFIDDEKGLVDLAKKMLEYLGYQVVTSTSSIEALKLFMEGPDRFDLVITDMTMPHMTGDKLSGEILRIRPDIPIMLCTGFSEMISEDKAKSLGIREYISKPVIMNTLSEKIRKVLDHRIDD